MKWLKSNYTTLLGAILLSLLTVGMLKDPGEVAPPLQVRLKFNPRVLADVGSLQYRVDGKIQTDTIPVWVTGDPAQIQAINLTLTCRPSLDESKFDPDPAKYETSIVVTADDIDLSSDLAKRIHVQPVTVAITYARLVLVNLPVKATAADVHDSRGARFRIDAVTVEPPEIKAKIPANQVNAIKELPIKPIRIGVRTSTFRVQGEINTDIVDVKSPEPFFVTVELSPIQFNMTMENVPLFLSCPPMPGMRAELLDKPAIRVVLDGRQDIVEKLKPEQVHVYVKLDWTPASRPGDFSLSIRYELPDEALRKSVRVSLAPGEPNIAVVRVTQD